MDVFEAINKRRSVRSYKADPIPEPVLSKVLDVMRQAPSAANRQPWKFLILKDQAIRESLVTQCGGQKFLKQAPVIVVACGLKDQAWKGVGGHPEASAIDIDLSIAIDHLTLAAVAEGLGTCWICAFKETCLKNLLKIPDTVKIVALTPLGYPASKDLIHPLNEDARKTSSELFCEDSYS